MKTVPMLKYTIEIRFNVNINSMHEKSMYYIQRIWKSQDCHHDNQHYNYLY